MFWHWKQTGTPERGYETRQRAFHAALAAAPSSGFLGSFSVGVLGAPWAAAGGHAYEDWYLLENFGALGALNEAAISASRAAPHDAAAAVAAGGTGGLYDVRLGASRRAAAGPAPGYAHWFGKPDGVGYEDLLGQLSPIVEAAQGTLWMRKMTLGPAREFCLHAPEPASLPARLEALVLPMRPVWPEWR